MANDGNAGRNLLYSYSLDSGITWSEQRDSGLKTTDGEGSLRCQIVPVGHSFYVFYYNPDQNQTLVARLDMEREQPASGEVSTVSAHLLDTLKVYPNPTPGKLVVEQMGPLRVTILTLSGQTLHQARGQDRLFLDITRLNNGLYILQVNN
ncbi:MAG: T9SS type A sorting domain-containing protein [Cytophagales bacterium]|nr:T9SS type A sorting domain-containing protein [Cytophagales bacterium]